MMNRRTFTKSALLASGGLLAVPEANAITTRSSLRKLGKKMVLISVNLGFLPKNFSPDNDNALNSRYLAKFKPVHHKMSVFNDIEQPERLGGHRNHHSVFTCQSRFGNVKTPFVSLDQLLATKSVQETRQKFTSICTSSREGMSFNMNGDRKSVV